MKKLILFFKNLTSRTVIRECKQDPDTGEYYCYEKVQGVYKRVGGPFPTPDACRESCGC